MNLNNNRIINNLIYLAIPYTWNPEKSFKIANEVAAKLMNEGNIIFSPISHSHPIADYLDSYLRINQEFWMRQDLPILSKCDKIIIVNIGENGQELIKNSKGCQTELKKAKELNLPIEFYNYDNN